MNLRKKLTAIALIVLCVFTVTVPLVSVATATESAPMVGEGLAPPENTAPSVGEGLTPPENTAPSVGDGLAPSEKNDLLVYLTKEDKTVTMSLEDYIAISGLPYATKANCWRNLISS